MKKIALSCIIMIIGIFPIFGIEGDDVALDWFPPSTLLTSYPWESRSTSNRLEFQNANRAPTQYPWAGGYAERVTVGIRLGVDVPLLRAESGNWAIYAGSPFSIEVVDDFFEPHTAPIVNMNFVFGMKLEGLYRLDAKWPKNIAFRSLPFFHESTHLGDEVSLAMVENDPDRFYRINVSYEAWELAIGIDEWEHNGTSAYNLRLGLGGNWNSDGYYNIPAPSERGDLLSPVYPSRKGMEYFGQFNVVIPRGFPAIGPWVFQGGLEFRNRILFDYFSNLDEKRAWTIIASTGWYRYPQGYAGRRLGLYIRIHYGQNPQGQFREQDGYFVFASGFSIGY